jgi:hypothetical protein
MRESSPDCSLIINSIITLIIALIATWIGGHKPCVLCENEPRNALQWAIEAD